MQDFIEDYWWLLIPFIIIGLIILYASIPFIIVNAGERAVITRFGQVNRVEAEGLHWVTPIVEGVNKLDVKTQKEQVGASAASKDLQNVTASVALNYNLTPDKVGELWNKIGYDYKSRIIDPAIQESVKAVTANYTAEELITKRESVKQEILNALKERLQVDFISVTDLSIVNFNFSQSFDEAIENKVTAEQNALAAKNKLDQVKYEAEQRIAQAQGEANAIKIQAQAIQTRGGAEYLQLKAIEKWNGTVPQYMMGNAVPFVNLK